MSERIPDWYGDAVRPWAEALEGWDRVERIRRGKWVHATAPRPEAGLTPHEVIHTHDKLSVRYYPARAEGPGVPVVVVPSLINRAWICDLEPGRSLVEGLAERGHPVYLIDWGVPAEEDADEDVAYVLLTLLHHSIVRIARHARVPAVHLFGYCMGGTLAAMYTAVRPRRVASLCTLAAPVRFADSGRFHDLVADMDVDAAFPEGQLVPVDVMQPAFQLLDPVGSVTKYAGIDAAALSDDQLRRVMVRERWLEENVPMSGAFAREFIRSAYQQDRLMDASWDLDGETVDLSRIACPTLVCACERDFVAPKAAVTPLAMLVPGSRLEVLEAGHIGVVVGSMGPRMFYPLLDGWFREVSP